MYYDPDDGFSASSWLSTMANTLYNDYLDYWEQQNLSADSEYAPEDRLRFKLLIDVAAALRPALHTLSAGQSTQAAIRAFVQGMGAEGEIGHQLAADFARLLPAHPIVSHGIEIQLASEAADGLLSNAEQRVGDLVELISTRHLSERAAAYLDRATRLYLWGFEPEAIVMCAAVLEAAYESRFEPIEMFRLQIKREGEEFKPHQYEHAAVTSKVYTTTDRDMARRIRQARNDIVHGSRVANGQRGRAKLLSCRRLRCAIVTAAVRTWRRPSSAKSSACSRWTSRPPTRRS